MKFLVVIFSTLIMLIKPFNLYVLKLVKNKFYIGKTTKNVTYRFNQHKNGFGSQWTKLYQPVKIIEQFETMDNFEEDKYTKKYMNKYGIDNVRGGSYSNVILNEWQIKAIEHELRTTNDLCFNCGKAGHFASECKIVNDFNQIK